MATSKPATIPAVFSIHDNTLRVPALVGEFLGCFILEFLTGCLTVNEVDGRSSSGLVTEALGIGFSYTVAMFIMRGVSGAHLNPAVTLGIMATCPPLAYEFNPIQASAYIFCQLGGSILGAIMSVHLIPMGSSVKDAISSEDSEGEAYVHKSGTVTFGAIGSLTNEHGVSVFIFEFVCTFTIVW